MDLNHSFVNSTLYEAKVELLKDLLTHSEDIISNSSYSCSFYFHGFLLNFFSEDLNLVQKVSQFLPLSWKKKTKGDDENTIDLFLIDKWGSDWDLEENPECKLDKKGSYETAVQRDFVGIDFGHKVIFSLEQTHGDGIFNVLRWLLPRRMITKGFFLLHSSCVVNEQKANFFLGHSGAGKSTLATLSGERMVLGDDMNVMRFDSGKVFARAGGLGGMSFEGTDFDNEFPVANFYWLIQDTVDSKLPMKKSQAVSKLLASLANVFWEFMTVSEKEILIDLATKVIESTDFYELHFTKTEECWKNVI